MWFNNAPSDAAFSKTAHTNIHFEIPVKASLHRLFEIMTTEENQHVWAKGYVKTVWHNEKPHGVGTVRDIVLEHISVRERFTVWEEGKRVAFSADALTVPLAENLMEDIRFEAVSEEGSLIIWDVYYTPRWWVLPLAGLLTKHVFTPMFRQFAEGFAQYAEKKR